MVLHTGQHYDAAMSDAFFADLDLPVPQFNLGVGSGGHGKQTGLMLAGIEQVLLDVKPDVVVVYGDTNSTLAGALAAVKLRIPVAHVEAGLRSFRREMPEEINRIVADHVCDLLLVPTLVAEKNLFAEGLAKRAKLTGDLMLDAVLHYREVAALRSSIGTSLTLETDDFGVVTVHRAENTDDICRLRDLLSAFNQIAEKGMKLVFPVHPRTRHRMKSEISGWAAHPDIRLVDPVGYLDTLWLLDHARVTLTDSGGLQKEAFFLGCPCVTLREETEWVETVALGGNILAGTDPVRICDAVNDAASRQREDRNAIRRAAMEVFGSGNASTAILKALVALGTGDVAPPPGAVENARESAIHH